MESATAQPNQTVLPPLIKPGLWNEGEPVLDAQGNLKRGGMWAEQRRWWNLKNFARVLVGGYGSGKSQTLCKRMIALSLTNAPAPCAIVSPSYPFARKTVIVSLEELLYGKQSLLHDFVWDYHQTHHLFTIWYKGRVGRIYILSADDPDSLRGVNLGAAGIDEPFVQEYSVFTQMVARLRHPQAKSKELLLAGTPEQLNWGYDLCMGQIKSHVDVGVVRISTRSNKVLKGYAEQLEGVFTGKAADAFIEGEFTSLADGNVFYAFNGKWGSNNCNMQVLDYTPGDELFCGMDFNVDPMAAVVGWRRGNHLHIFDEIELPNADTQYMCSILREKYVDNAKYRNHGNWLENVYPDPTGNQRHSSAPGGVTDFYYLKQAGFKVCAHEKSPKERDQETAVNNRLAPKNLKSDEYPPLTIDPKCKNLLKYLGLYNHKEKNTTEQKAMSHLLKAMTYAVEYQFPVTKSFSLAKVTGY